MTKENEVQERFWAKVLIDGLDDCWRWKGCLVRGYGQFNLGQGSRKRVYAHRFSYEQLVGKVPTGLDLDHLCRNRSCVNPRHLEPVTRSQNLVRGVSANRSKTHCVNGHEFSQKNTIISKLGHRNCRLCKNASRGRRKDDE